MKSFLTKTITLVKGFTISSQINSIETTTGVKYVIISYIDDEPYYELSRLHHIQPDYETLRERHNLIVNRFCSLVENA